MLIVAGRKRIQWLARLVDVPGSLQLGRCESCDLFELAGKVGNAAVAKTVGNFTQVELVIKKQLFGPLDLLPDNVLLDRNAFYGREQVAKVVVFIMDFFGEHHRPVKLPADTVGVVDHGDDLVLDRFDQSCPAVVDPLETDCRKGGIQPVLLLFGDGIFFQRHFSQGNLFRV